MFVDPPSWNGTSSDPNDEQFGHVVTPATLDEADTYEAVFVGEPYDGAVIGRPGTRKAPDAIREALSKTKTHHFETGAVSSVGDLGDLNIDSTSEDVSEIQSQVINALRKVHAADSLPVCLGGDNSLSFANAMPLLDESLGVVSLDAHLDCREVRTEVGPTSGTPYRQLHDAGLDAFAVVGARHFETSTRYANYVTDRDGVIVTADEVSQNLEHTVARIHDAMESVDRIYLSVDIDVLDTVHGPGVSAPTPGGLSTRDLFRLVDAFASDERIAGFEIVECAPPLDLNDQTVRAAARTVAHFLANYTSTRPNQ